ncbi:adhesin [Pseudomonas brassicacearum]|uniref:CS1 type fimbrial major subunit n=1 Tax=Pseudomonas brassicacearum TaxID=930166 RepID=UPI000F49DA51|nr:CS1 type fimbrial major subunit [Pseudomonas brassicacearum]ROM67003.1 adhesin [Pseudomonas brassicacearum]
MLKKVVPATALVVAAMSPSWVSAADDARTSIHITANIPNKQFHVQPRNPDFGRDEVMHYNPANNSLSTVRQTFDVKNTDGSIHAYIQEGRAYLDNGWDRIPLSVTFNGVYLDGVPQEVVDDASSTPGTQAEMVIRYNGMSVERHPGLYTGQFTVIYDAVPRVSAL